MRSEMTSIGKGADYLSGTLVLAITLPQGMQLQNTLDGKLIFFSPLRRKRNCANALSVSTIHGVAGNYPRPSWRQS